MFVNHHIFFLFIRTISAQEAQGSRQPFPRHHLQVLRASSICLHRVPRQVSNTHSIKPNRKQSGSRRTDPELGASCVWSRLIWLIRPRLSISPITTFRSTRLSLVSFRALFWSVPLSPLEQNCFLLGAQPQMQAEETRRSTMCCRSRSDSARAHFLFFLFWFFSGLIYSCKLHIFQLSRSPSPIHFSSLFITSDSLYCSPHGKQLWSCCAALSPWN